MQKNEEKGKEGKKTKVFIELEMILKIQLTCVQSFFHRSTTSCPLNKIERKKF